MLADEETCRYYDDEAFTDVSQAQRQIESWAIRYEAHRCVRWGIALKADSCVIGTFGYYGFDTWNAYASIGYELARLQWRKGIMTEALAAIVEFGFQTTGLNRIQAVVMPGNVASERLLEKLGFQAEGVLREYENWGTKGFVDLTMYSLLRADMLLESR